MDTSTKWLIGIVVFLAAAVLIVGLGVLGLVFPLTTDSGSGPDPVPAPAPADPEPEPTEPGPEPTEPEPTEPGPIAPISDGRWFAFIEVGEDESGEVTLGVDLAEMLTGEEAHDAAVEDGVIGEDEDLPNDFYIDNPDRVYELIHVADTVRISVLDGTDPGQRINIDTPTLVALYEGTYDGPAVYGVVAGTPIAMDVSIETGLVAVADAVYLP